MLVLIIILISSLFFPLIYYIAHTDCSPKEAPSEFKLNLPKCKVLGTKKELINVSKTFYTVEFQDGRKVVGYTTGSINQYINAESYEHGIFFDAVIGPVAVNDSLKNAQWILMKLDSTRSITVHDDNDNPTHSETGLPRSITINETVDFYKECDVEVCG